MCSLDAYTEEFGFTSTRFSPIPDSRCVYFSRVFAGVAIPMLKKKKRLVTKKRRNKVRVAADQMVTWEFDGGASDSQSTEALPRKAAKSRETGKTPGAVGVQ